MTAGRVTAHPEGAATEAAPENLLELRQVKTHFPVGPAGVLSKTREWVKAVDGVDLSIAEGEILGLVGESGCGKSTLARTIVQLMPQTAGEIRFEGRVLHNLSKNALRKMRTRLQMVFQDPYASLNPRMTVYRTLAEPLYVHRMVPPGKIPGRVAELMQLVGLQPRFIRKYPHEFSGGQRQRIAIARALALEPRMILADEPVSALDVSVQAQILNLLNELCGQMNLTMLFISHDLSVVRHLAGRIAVMYLGKIVEIGDTGAVFEHPRHPYTRALLSAIPRPDPVAEVARKPLILRGDPPSPLNPPPGCAFHPRCPYAIDQCAQTVPPLELKRDGRRVACIRAEEIEDELQHEGAQG